MKCLELNLSCDVFVFPFNYVLRKMEEIDRNNVSHLLGHSESHEYELKHNVM